MASILTCFYEPLAEQYLSLGGDTRFICNFVWNVTEFSISFQMSGKRLMASFVMFMNSLINYAVLFCRIFVSASYKLHERAK
jgi:hypothetical protein